MNWRILADFWTLQINPRMKAVTHHHDWNCIARHLYAIKVLLEALHYSRSILFVQFLWRREWEEKYIFEIIVRIRKASLISMTTIDVDSIRTIAGETTGADQRVVKLGNGVIVIVTKTDVLILDIDDMSDLDLEAETGSLTGEMQHQS